MQDTKGPDGKTDNERGFAWGSPEHIAAIGGAPDDTLELAFHKQAMERANKRLEKHDWDFGKASKFPLAK